MQLQDKKNIKNNMFIEYLEYKIESNKKYIQYLSTSNEIYKTMIEIRKRELKKEEEIEVLDE